MNWLRHAAAEEALFAPRGPQGWHLFDELMKCERMLTEKSREVAAAVKAVGDQVEGLLGTHCKQREVWKAVRHMMSDEDAWLYRGQPGDDAESEACEMQRLLAMMGTSVEVQDYCCTQCGRPLRR